MNSAMLGANAPKGASSDVAIQYVSAAAPYTPTNASTSAALVGETGTIAARNVWGARPNACPSVTMVARVGTPATAVEGSVTSAASHTPMTVTTPSRTSGFQWRR